MNIRWGRDGNLDYWAALAAGEVNPPEERAMTLLASVCDPYRFSLYCMTGCLAAIGNLTRTVYLIRHRLMILELDDGLPVASWCISIGPHANVPPTDNVVAIKALIEGEEGAFRRTGNRMEMFPGDDFAPHILGVRDPFTQRFIDFEEPREVYLARIANGSMLDQEGAERAAAGVAIRMERSWMEAVVRHHNASSPEEKVDVTDVVDDWLYPNGGGVEFGNLFVGQNPAPAVELDAVRREIEEMGPLPVYA